MIDTNISQSHFERLRKESQERQSQQQPFHKVLPKRATFLKTGQYLDTRRVAPVFHDPRYTSSTLALPSDQRTLYGLYRFFAETDPIVGSALKIHSELPIAGASLKPCSDEFINKHYEEMWHRIGGIKLLESIISEYYEIGDVFLFGAFDMQNYMWDQFAILNPDYVKIESVWINKQPLIKLVPDEALKKLVKTRTPRVLYDQLPEDVKKYVMFSQEIPLNPDHVFHLSHAKRPYETRGRSLIKRILKVLMLEDRLNQANFALATRHVVPVTVIKVGDPQTGYIPSEEELDAVRDMFAAYELDPNFAIIYHWGIDIQYYGSNGRMLPISPELERIYRLKFIGLQIHEQLMAGVGGSYAQAYLNLDVLRQRYLSLQLRIEAFIDSIFRAVADVAGFYKLESEVAGPYYSGKKYASENGNGSYPIFEEYNNPEFKEFLAKKAAQQSQKKRYVYPTIDWGRFSAARDESLKNYIMWLTSQRPWLVDDATLLHLANLDRSDQLNAFIKDLERDKKMQDELTQRGLFTFAQMRAPNAPFFATAPQPQTGGSQFPMEGVPMGAPGAMMPPNIPEGVINLPPEALSPGGVSGEMPPAPVGENYQSPYMEGMPPASPIGEMLSSMEREILNQVTEDDLFNKAFVEEFQKIRGK